MKNFVKNWKLVKVFLFITITSKVLFDAYCFIKYGLGFNNLLLSPVESIISSCINFVLPLSFIFLTYCFITKIDIDIKIEKK